MLVDRRTERSALDSVIASARGGMGSALVLRGEPGIGKTALLEYAIESAPGFRIARAVGVESEMELARALLGSYLSVLLDEQVSDRILTEMQGNPLALLELPRGFTPGELAGGFGVLGTPGLPGRIEQGFLRRYEAFPPAARQLLLVAAAEPLGDPMLLWRAAGRLGITPDAAAAAEADGLLVTGARVRFRHPLVRSAVYRAALPPQRRAVHQALAEATDPQADPDRRAWHLAQAAPGPDEEVAGELERRPAGRGPAAASRRRPRSWNEPSR